MTIDPAVIEEAAQAIAGADSIALACHVGPDGDALGSMLGLAIAAAGAGKEVVASFGSPHVFPPSLSFLPAGHLVPPEEFPEAPGLMVVLDAGSADRLGELGSNASKADTVLVIDHHVTNEGFGDIAVVDSDVGATGELVYEILKLLEWKITAEVAQCLHTALVTDTGRFTYANTTPHTLRIAADLVEAGAKPDVIGRHVYEEEPFGYLKAVAIAMERAELDPERRVVYTFITDEDLKGAGIDWGDTENLIDLLRLAVESDTAVLAKAHGDGRVKVSLRSRGDTDVGGLAAAMGGGGHRLAAGFTAQEDIESVLAKVLAVVEDYR
ncbi:MAG TPA: bifunctional oligoribonuclease/PAP phosphatase NrnA [Acidimicrobiia bacterium]|nr:bifunctional oligoribonuclease/PAP phosphatase NrnA [Acidimicrobiia bacterium]